MIARMLERLIRAIDRSPFWFHFVNLCLVLVWALFVLVSYTKLAALDARSPVNFWALFSLQAANSGLLVVFFALRRRSTELGADVLSVFLAHAGTWVPLLPMLQTYWKEPSYWIPPEWVMKGGIWALVASCAVTSLNFISLGRSWGVIPANRGVRSGGMYRLVRHPIYANYILFYWVFLVISVHWTTIVVAITLPVLLFLRAKREERVLRKDPGYVAYADRTRYMFFPGLI